MPEATIIGQRIRYDVRPGSGIPLVLLCGIGASYEVLQPLVDALDPSLEVVRLDVPGVGGSPAGPLPYGFPVLAWMVDKLLGRLEYGTVDVLGLSWGGGLAQQLALQHPRRVRRLVLVSTATGMLMVPGRPSVLRRMATPRRFRDPAYAAGMAAYLYGGSARHHAPDIRRMFGEQVAGGSLRGYLHQLATGACWTSLPFLPFIRQRTLVMAGDDDPIVPLVNGRILARLIPNAGLHVFPGGHVELVTEAASLAPVVSTFLLEG